MSPTQIPPVPLAALPPADEFIHQSETVHLLVLSPGGALLQWNEAARRGLGSHVALAEGMPVGEFLVGTSGAWLRAALEARSAHPVRSLLTFSDGETFAFTLSCSLHWRGDACYLFGEHLAEREKQINAELLEVTNELVRLSRDRARLTAELERALEEIRTSHWQIRKIQEFLPICAVCHKVPTRGREEEGWEPLLAFLADNGLFMTHGFCPSCHENVMASLEDPPAAP